MDGPQFDTLAKLVGGSHSRRGLLKALVGGTAAGLAGRLAREQPAAAAASPCDFHLCRRWALDRSATCRSKCKSDPQPGACIVAECKPDLDDDLNYCHRSGGCAEPTTCHGGVCCLSAEVNCGDGVCCNGNCCNGKCCDASQPFCANGACAPCPAGQTTCPGGGGTCFVVSNDNRNCGGCGVVCGPCEACQNGSCASTCLAGETCCGGRCLQCEPGQVVDPNTCFCRCPDATCPAGKSQNPSNCQCECTTACAPGLTQDPATCACGCGGAACAGTCCNGACVDPQSDNGNCGGCGTACTGGKTCQGGQCVCGGLTPDPCNGVCTNFRNDPGSCGGCGAVFACPAAFPTCCPSAALGTGLCTDLQGEGANCGACGNACTGGKTCQNGACACPSGTTDCGGACVDTQSDDGNCGGCGAACGAGTTCQGGRCACAAGTSACGGTCVDTATDPGNCGGCGAGCAAGLRCRNGTCCFGSTLAEVGADPVCPPSEGGGVRHCPQEGFCTTCWSRDVCCPLVSGQACSPPGTVCCADV